MSAETQEILMNKEALAVDQDAAGIQGHRVRKDGDLEVWSKQLADGGRAVVLFNRSGAEAKISVAWQDLGYPASLSAGVRDLWAHKDLGKMSGKYEASVASHGVVMIKVTNGTEETVRVCIWSNRLPVATSVYPDSEKVGAGEGRSKKAAEQVAAEQALRALGG